MRKLRAVAFAVGVTLGLGFAAGWSLAPSKAEAMPCNPDRGCGHRCLGCIATYTCGRGDALSCTITVGSDCTDWGLCL
ncbi:MAG: hypothetical protein AMXMBFR34_54290 [Myxococcaceae bacterium]